MIDPGLENRTVLITGANNPMGIGAATAEAFARVGARVFLHYYCDLRHVQTASDDSEPGEALYYKQQGKTVDEVVRRVERSGVVVGTYGSDLTEPSAAGVLFAEAERRCGAIDVLVNNAAAWRSDTFIPCEQPSRRQLHPLMDAKRKQITAQSFNSSSP